MGMTEKTAEEIAAETKAAEKVKIVAERASIKADVGQKMLTDEEKEAAATKEAEVAAEAAKAAEVEAAKVAAAEGKVDDKGEEIEDLEAAKEAAKTTVEKDKFQKRIDRETAKRKALEAEIKELKAKLASEPDKENALTEEEVEKRSEEKANHKQMMREFEAASDRLFKAGVKEDKLFQAKINELADDIGKIPGHMIGILDDLDNGGAILVHFTNNHDEAQEIYEMSPAKAAVKVAKLSAKLEAEKKPVPKAISKVPDPAEPIKGGSSNPDVLPKDPTSHMADFVRIRAKQVEARRLAKLAGMH